MPASERTFAVSQCGLVLSTYLTWAALAPPLSAQQTRDPANPEGRWEVLEDCTLATNSVADGDSFTAQHKGRTYIFRLYFVDAPEADASLRERIDDQAAYFGIPASDIPRGGRLSAQFTQEKLAGRRFTVVTRWQNAMGRSSLARFYSIVLVKGENLGEQLVANGLARIYGLRANWPDGTRSATVINKLKNLELTARGQQRGLWNETVFPRLGIDSGSADGKPGGKISTGTVDVNEADAQELQRLPGIGPKLAERIIAHRPYEKVDDLLKVPGIGPRNIERFRSLVRVEGAEDSGPAKQ